YRILVKVKAAAPIRRVAVRLKPMGCENGKVLQIVIDYPDCVRPVKVSTITEPTHDRYLSRPIISSSTTEISPAKSEILKWAM
ncbi:unnamed protein product, partial [marine sediment metagenome]